MCNNNSVTTNCAKLCESYMNPRINESTISINIWFVNVAKENVPPHHYLTKRQEGRFGTLTFDCFALYVTSLEGHGICLAVTGFASHHEF